MFDVHSHLQFSEYDADRAAVIARMKAAEVKTITVGVDLETSQQAIALAEQYPDDVWATVGVHPTADFRFQISEIKERLLPMARHPKVVAIGECGLDYFRIKNDAVRIKKEQKEVFLEQIKIAEEVTKPLMIHCRPSKGTDDAYDDLINILSSHKSTVVRKPAIIHFFVGSRTVAEQLLALGCYFTFGGVITFARDYDEVIRVIPLERILLETDAPYVAPEPYRGKRNEPRYVRRVAHKLAELKQMSVEEVMARTAMTARAVFSI